MATTFRRISRSSRNEATSLRSLTSSSSRAVPLPGNALSPEAVSSLRHLPTWPLPMPSSCSICLAVRSPASSSRTASSLNSLEYLLRVPFTSSSMTYPLYNVPNFVSIETGKIQTFGHRLGWRHDRRLSVKDKAPFPAPPDR